MEYEIIKNTLNTEQECREYLASIRWRKGFCCPKCNGKEAWVTSEIKYKCKKCGHKMSVTSGTVFQDSHIPLQKWFLAISILLKNKEITITDFQKELELGSNRTAIRMKDIINHKIMYEHILEHPRLLYDRVELIQAHFEYRNQKIFAFIAADTNNIKPYIAIQRKISDQTLNEFLTSNIKQDKNQKTVIEISFSPIPQLSDYFDFIPLSINYAFYTTKHLVSEIRCLIQRYENELSFDELCKRYVIMVNKKCGSIDYSASYTKTVANMLK